MKLQNIGNSGCEYLSKAKWKNMTTLDLCMLFQLNLDDNNIGDEGCEYLSKADWKHLTILNLCITLI